MASSQLALADPSFDLLRKIGLSKYESMLYLALVRFGCGCYRELIKWSTVPYGRVYYVLERLRMKGFVYKEGERPAVYRAVEPMKAFQSYFLDQYDRIISDLQERYAAKKSVVHSGHDEFLDNTGVWT